MCILQVHIDSSPRSRTSCRVSAYRRVYLRVVLSTPTSNSTVSSFYVKFFFYETLFTQLSSAMLTEESDFTLSAYRRVYLRCSLPTVESNCTQSLGHCFLGNCAYFTLEIAPHQSLIVFLFTLQVSYVSCSPAESLGNSKVGWKTAESCLYREVGLHWVMHDVYCMASLQTRVSCY